jgi:aromatic amino acid aminotransferase I
MRPHANGVASDDSLPTSVDLSRHINKHSKARHPSPLKDIIKFMAYDGMISLSGGKPDPQTLRRQHIRSF